MNKQTDIVSPVTGFRPNDTVLAQLVAERRQEVVARQRAEVEAMAEQESRGQATISRAMEELDGGLKDLIDRDSTAAAVAEEDRVRQELIEAAPSDADLNEDPGSAALAISPAAFSGWLTPYHATIHGSDGQIDWQGYNPGNLNVSAWARGSGSGIAGTGAASFHAYVDWWFSFRPDAARFYAQRVHVPFSGFYITRANDGFFNSKRARTRINLSARGYQYNWKGTTSTNRLNVDDDNVNVNRRFDGWQSFNYSSLLGADQAYLRVSLDLYVYARGSGSYSELNFSTGAGNYLGIPRVFVS